MKQAIPRCNGYRQWLEMGYREMMVENGVIRSVIWVKTNAANTKPHRKQLHAMSCHS